MTEENIFENVTYLLSYPENFSTDKKWPLVIFLHGSQARSSNTEVLRNYSAFLKLQARQEYGYVLLAPLCNASNWNEIMAYLIALVDNIRNLPFIDTTRVYLTGNSMGGYGTWELASLRPDWFAAIMPVCGGGIKWMTDTIADIPIRTFHGLCDVKVDPIESLEMVKAVNRHGGNAELILFPRLEHNCWDKVYTTKEKYDWLLSFSTERKAVATEEYPEDY